MQVRSGDAPGGADLADLRSRGHLLSSLHLDRTQVTVHGDQTAAVIENDSVAIEEEVTGIDHAPARGGAYRRAAGGRDIHAAVGIARLVVEHPTQAVGARASAGYGLQQPQRSGSMGREDAVVLMQPWLFAVDTREVGCRQVHLTRGHGEALHAVLLVSDLELD